MPLLCLVGVHKSELQNDPRFVQILKAAIRPSYYHNLVQKCCFQILIITTIVDFSAQGTDPRGATTARTMAFIKPDFEVRYGLVDLHGLLISAPVEVICWDIRAPKTTIKLALPSPTLTSFSWPGRFSSSLFNGFHLIWQCGHVVFSDKAETTIGSRQLELKRM